jgi:hypothetical protein
MTTVCEEPEAGQEAQYNYNTFPDDDNGGAPVIDFSPSEATANSYKAYMPDWDQTAPLSGDFEQARDPASGASSAASGADNAASGAVFDPALSAASAPLSDPGVFDPRQQKPGVATGVTGGPTLEEAEVARSAGEEAEVPKDENSEDESPLSGAAVMHKYEHACSLWHQYENTKHLYFYYISLTKNLGASDIFLQLRTLQRLH